MIPDRTFLRSCARKHNLALPRELEDWLLVQKERCDGLKDLILDLRVDVAYLQELCDKYEHILKEHNLL